MLRIFFPEFWAFILWLRNSHNIPAKLPVKFPSQESKKNITDELLQERREEKSGGRPGPKAFTPSLGPQENKVSCADVFDPKARHRANGVGREGGQAVFNQILTT